ncbi:hypothetical protein [Roseibium sp. MMSF_3412]|uniref:hypothetical protein n=1 Tax=Roseibium sp. MMSF_3412 TaxID=3046712 RepID=UPI00273FEB4D|nr:hypothetical protein [Roseibium sp. MMSF_3412]
MKDFSFQISWGRKEKTPGLDPGEAAWPFNSDSPVIDGLVRPSKAVSIMLVNLCGLGWEDIELLLPAARKGAKDQDMLPVIVVDLTDLVPLQETGLAYDALPNVTAGALSLPELDWRAYFVRRKDLLLEKWQPEAIVHLGNDKDW